MAVQMTPEQLQQLVEAIRGSAVSTPSQPKGNFSNCPVRFGGIRDHNVVEEFITGMTTYKDVECISDSDALKSLSLLFYGLASTWWQGVKKEAETWQQAIELIRSHFSPTKQPYQVYMEIFQEKQEENVSIDEFVCKKRALFAQLPDGRHNEETQLDFLYGLLNIKYRKKIPRDEAKTFKELLEKGRIIEQTIAESQEAGRSERKSGGSKVRCTYCNYRGHNSGDCRKRRNAEKGEE